MDLDYYFDFPIAVDTCKAPRAGVAIKALDLDRWPVEGNIYETRGTIGIERNGRGRAESKSLQVVVNEFLLE